MKPLLFSFAAMADFMRKSIEKLPLPTATVHTGPGRKSLYTLHKGAHNRKIEAVYRPAGSIVARPANAAHRLELLEDRFNLKHDQPSHLRESWSLFITGPVRRPWGFWCPQGWVFWQDFSDPTGLKPGKGCEE